MKFQSGLDCMNMMPVTCSIKTSIGIVPSACRHECNLDRIELDNINPKFIK